MNLRVKLVLIKTKFLLRISHNNSSVYLQFWEGKAEKEKMNTPSSHPLVRYRDRNISGDIFFYCIFLVTYCHLWPPPPPPDRWSTKHFSSCSSSLASCRWPSILFASRSPSVQILMNFCSRQLLHAFDQFILSHPLSSHVFNLLHGDHHLPSSNSSNVIHSIANAIAHSPFKWLIPAGEKSLFFQIMFSCLTLRRTK